MRCLLGFAAFGIWFLVLLAGCSDADSPRSSPTSPLQTPPASATPPVSATPPALAPPPCTADPPPSPGLPPPYPLENSNLEKFDNYPRDADGVIYDPQYDEHNPALVAKYALALYAEHFETHEEERLADFSRQAEWLRENFVRAGAFGVWQYPFDYEPFEASAPWVSALMQGWGLTVMLEAAALNPEQADAYESIAELALQAFEVPVADGGVRSTWDDGTVWYEEYATAIPSHVLNGFMFALAGLYQDWQQTGDERAEALFEQGTASLKAKVREYDKGFTSAYEVYLNSNATGKGGYHSLHVQQLLWVYCVTADEFFWDLAVEWVNYDGWTNPAGSFVKDVEASYEPAAPEFAAEGLIDNTNYYGYWSSDRFPVVITLDLGQVERDVSRIVFFAVTEASAPDTFTVELSSDREGWDEALTVTEGSPAARIRGENATGVHRTAIYGYDLEDPGDARYVRVTIGSDQGAANVALREIMLHFDQAAHTREIYEELLPRFDRPPGGRVASQ